jgi:hypothetical protein
MNVRGLLLVIGFVFGCGSDKIFLDTGYVRGDVEPAEEASPRTDTAVPESETAPPVDADGDGTTPEDGDCDDEDASIHPGAEERCNGLDDDCDGLVDEDLSYRVWYADADGDGFGDADATRTDCAQPEGYVAEPGDCDDTDPDTYRDALELCDAKDNDCDTLVDEDVTTRYYRDLDGDGYGSPFDIQDACDSPMGFVAVGTDCDDTDSTVNPGGIEICNEIDDDCDGLVDEDVGTTTWYSDEDGDGYGAAEITGSVCSELPLGHVLLGGDCDDSDPLSFPEAEESCDGVDNDCDGEIDEDGGTVWYADLDGDGAGDAGTVYIGCSAPSDHVSTPFDCDDTDAAVRPGGTEICNGVDDDCDGEVDEAAIDALIWHRDLDGDGFGDPDTTLAACTLPSGYVADATDCDDTEGAIHPDADEICNGLDDDCDDLIDAADGDLSDGAIYYLDSDGDGWGTEDSDTLACAEPSGWSGEAGDCDDADPEVHPEGAEICDGLDNDCDGITDPDALDSDGDGIANCVDETVYMEDFSSDAWGDWGSWHIGGNAPVWNLTGRYLVEQSNAADAIAYSPYLGTLDDFTLSVDIMQGGGSNNGCGIAFAVEEGAEVVLIEWQDPTHYYGWWWYPGSIIVYELRAGSWIALASVSSSIDLSRGYTEWATLSVTMTGSLMQIYLDDELALSHAFVGDLDGPGRVGVWTWDNDSGVYFDNVSVTQPAP